MVLLTTAAAFALLGIVVFVVGLAADRPELAMFGAVIVIGVGGTGVVQGYQVETGTNETTESLTTVGPAEHIPAALNFTTSVDVSGEMDRPSEVDYGAKGEYMYIVGRSSDTVYQYDISAYSASPKTLVNEFEVTEDSRPDGLDIGPNGTKMYIAGDQNDAVFEYTLSEQWNVSTASLNGSLDVSSETTDPSDVALCECKDGELRRLYVADGDGGDVEWYNLTTPGDVTTGVHQLSYDVAGQDEEPTGIAFDDDGGRMLLVGYETANLYQYDLAVPFNLSTASYDSPSADLSTETTQPSGVTFHEDRVLVTADQDVDVKEYAARQEVATTERKERKVYRDVSTVASFPLEIVVLLLGAVMLMSGAGEASEQGRDDPPWRRDR
jgi:sugar lactone lactonase YvrE